MSVIIQEHLYDEKECSSEALVDSIHSIMFPLQALCRVLSSSEEGDLRDLAEAMEPLLHQAADMQAELVDYLEQKLGKVEIVHPGGECKSYQTFQSVCGIKLNGHQVKNTPQDSQGVV